jgi:hypothetical protein
MNEQELGLQSLGTRALMATSVGIQPHWISPRPIVVLESPKALISSQYLCGTAKDDSLHIVDKVQIRDLHRELQLIRALIDCGATRIFMSPQLLNRLRLPNQAAHITTPGLDGQVVAQARESRKMAMTVQYMDHLVTVDESEVLVIRMRAYDLVTGIP